ncbi:MAG: phosphoethanolamine transferase [Xylophilus ampelinus]
MILSTPPPFLRAHALVAAAVLALIVLGHDGKRVLQLAGLAMPLVALMAWPIRRPRAHRIRMAVAWLWAMAFVVDGAARAYLLDRYGSAPDSTLVLTAIANTNARESAEYLAMHWRPATAWASAVLAAGLVLGRCARHAARAGDSLPKRSVLAVLALALALSALSYAGKSWRRLHPAVFWAQWAGSVAELRAGWSDRAAERAALLRAARGAAPSLAGSGPSTVVLVIADSVNRDNLGLYGYGRDTTPRLSAQKARLGDELLVLRNAWSADASTLPALRNLFGLGAGEAPLQQHLLALARAAGYTIWWISNHDDIGIEQQHARFADVVEMANRTPGRSGASLDGALLDGVRAALDDPADRKLVVVHLMGAHPHYRLRFPPGANPFGDAPDRVEAGLADQGRPAWVRRLRQEYDAALLYHDSVVSETLELARSAGRAPAGRRAWMYLSDHAQEVGHGGDHAGHSPRTASGYRIPALVWRGAPATAPAGPVEARPFRSDWAGWTLADLMGLRWPGQAPERDVLDPGYRWNPPALPFGTPSFAD